LQLSDARAGASRRYETSSPVVEDTKPLRGFCNLGVGAGAPIVEDTKPLRWFCGLVREGVLRPPDQFSSKIRNLFAGFAARHGATTASFPHVSKIRNLFAGFAAARDVGPSPDNFWPVEDTKPLRGSCDSFRLYLCISCREYGRDALELRERVRSEIVCVPLLPILIQLIDEDGARKSLLDFFYLFRRRLL